MSRRSAFTLVLPALLLAGCFTGKRPSFNDDPFPTGAMTGNASVDVVLGLLDNPTTGPATAAYTVLTKFGNTTTPAVVVLDAGSRSVSIGNTRYVLALAGSATCTVDGSLACIDSIDASRISNVGVTVDFYSSEAATRLRRDFRAATAPPTARLDVIADQRATCVEVPLAGGTAVYCALDNGLVARLDDGDVAVVLVQLSADVDDTKLQIPAV